MTIIMQWAIKMCCAKECCKKYDPENNGELPSMIKRYTNSLSRVDLRAFFGDRFTDDQTMIRGRTHVMEKPLVIEKLLAVDDPSLLPRPHHQSVNNVCQTYALWLCNKSTKWLNPTASNGDFIVDPAPSPRYREAAKRHSVKEWFEDCKDVYLCLPNDDKTVLPFSTTLATHASYVYEAEMLANPVLAKRTMDLMSMGELFSADQDDLEDGDDLEMGCDNFEHGELGCMGHDHDNGSERKESDEGDVSEDNPKKNLSGSGVFDAAAKVKFRYGNPLLGKKDEIFPECQDIAAYSYFCNIWKTNEVCKKIIIRKWIPFTKCDTCTKLREELKTRDRDKKIKIMAKVRDHIAFVKRERSFYYGNKARARKHKPNCLSMIIDGADQSNHQMPHFACKSHKTDAAWKMKLHLLGALVHGVGTWTYTVPSHIAQGNNVTIQVLWQTLVDIKRKKGKLPPILYLQLDNTTKQNKSHFLFGFLGLLVKMGVFEKVIVAFLPVGHTHEDIDQLFSRLAVYMRHHNALSRPALGECIRAAYKSREGCPNVVHWDRVANISGWLDKNKRTDKMKGITNFQHFRIFVPSTHSDEVWLQARTWPGAPAPLNHGDCWRGLKEGQNDVNIFPIKDQQPNLWSERHSIPPSLRPQGQTDVDKPTLKKHITNFQNGLEALYQHHRATFSLVHYQDCKKLIDMWKIPLQTPITFDWPDEEIITMGENRAAIPVDGSADEEDSNESDDLLKAGVGKYYIVAPSEGDKENHESKCPFYLLKVKAVEGSKAKSTCRVQWHTVHKQEILVQSKDTSSSSSSSGSSSSSSSSRTDDVDWYNSWWGPEVDCKEGTRYTEMQSLSVDEAWAMEVKMVSGGKNFVVKNGPVDKARNVDVPIKCFKIMKKHHQQIKNCVFRWRELASMKAHEEDLTFTGTRN